MAVQKRTEKFNLQAKTDADVILTITVGNAQLGSSVMRFKGSSDIIAKGEIKKCNLGSGSNLKGKILLVTTNILDSNNMTNGIVVTYYFASCDPVATTFDDEVKSDGDIFSFLLEIQFT